MKTVLTTLSMLLLSSAVATAAVDMTPCLDMHAEARFVSDGLFKVTAYGRWRCDAKVLGDAYMKTSVQGEPAGQALPFPGDVTVSQSAYVAGELPLKVCVDVEGRDRDGGVEVTARQCVLVEHRMVDLPKPVLQPRGLQVWSR